MEQLAKRPVRRSGVVLWVVAAVLVGGAIGLAAYTFIFAKGFSYFSSNPESCANCHVMEPYLDSWAAGPHQPFATCNDCHVPHENMVAKYAIKAENGFMHALKFTTGDFPENIEARSNTTNITNRACLYCHEQVTADIRHPVVFGADKEFDCVRCHSGVGHD
ncbi:cytochrome c nitrite reductase small subunit [Actinomyces minihominis]|uniref:cytochrome c nitrite reductase small subunit n=1 Tax=Actinomyces minihominis TaxID=2002838 RepID=UPI001F5D1E2F|nr:cytochrome c nitrite reductase small subunit [Actinomyces minihominis]